MPNKDVYHVVSTFTTKEEANAFLQAHAPSTSEVIRENRYRLLYLEDVAHSVMREHLRLDESQIKRIDMEDVLCKMLHLESREFIRDVTHIIQSKLQQQTQTATGRMGKVDTTLYVNITPVNGVQETVPFGIHDRCASCGKTTDEAQSVITGGPICEGEWACSDHCYDEIEQKGCAFDELGNMTYRPQTY